MILPPTEYLKMSVDTVTTPGESAAGPGEWRQEMSQHPTMHRTAHNQGLSNLKY